MKRDINHVDMLSRLILSACALLAFICPRGDNDDPCECEVVNKYTVTKGTGDCECTDPGSGSKVLPFTISDPVYPDGAPEAGECSAGDCEGDNLCTYKPVEATVTVAICARDCTKHLPSEMSLTVKTSYGPQWTTQPSSGTQNFNSTLSYTIGPPSATDANLCGSGPFEAKVEFKKKNGQNALKLTFEFGCGKCAASQSE
jgi:hypothetical protein